MSTRSLPKFPTTCDIYSGNVASFLPLVDSAYQPNNVGVPRHTNVPCEVVAHLSNSGSAAWNPVLQVFGYFSTVLIYFHKHTDVRDWMNRTTSRDTIVTADGWVFMIESVFPIAHGFDNEFLGATATPYTASAPP